MIKIINFETQKPRLEQFLTSFFRVYISDSIESTDDLEDGSAFLPFLKSAVQLNLGCSNSLNFPKKSKSEPIPEKEAWILIEQYVLVLYIRMFPFMSKSLPILIADDKKLSVLIFLIYFFYLKNFKSKSSIDEPDLCDEIALGDHEIFFLEIAQEITKFILLNPKGIFCQQQEHFKNQNKELLVEKTQLTEIYQSTLNKNESLDQKIKIFELESKQHRKIIEDQANQIASLKISQIHFSVESERATAACTQELEELKTVYQTLFGRFQSQLKEKSELTKLVVYHKTQVDLLIPFKQNAETLDPMLKFYISQNDQTAKKNSNLQTQLADLLSEIELLEVRSGASKMEQKRMLLENFQVSSQVDFINNSLRKLLEMMSAVGMDLDFKEIVAEIKHMLDITEKESSLNGGYSFSEKDEIKNLKEALSQIIAEVEVLVWRVREENLHYMKKED